MEEKQPEVKLLQTILESIVANPKDIKVKRTVDEMGVFLLFEVAKEDRGLVIGRQGSTIKLIRDILRITGIRNRARVTLKMDEPEKMERVAIGPVKKPLDDLNF